MVYYRQTFGLVLWVIHETNLSKKSPVARMKCRLLMFLQTRESAKSYQVQIMFPWSSNMSQSGVQPCSPGGG